MTPAPQAPRVLVVGCGGIGGILTAGLAPGFSDRPGGVTALTTNLDVVRAVRSDGLRIVGPEGEQRVDAEVVSELPEGARFDWILLATQPPQTEQAARDALPHLAEGGAFVCLQNGLMEDRIEALAGPGRVLGAIVSWGASMPEPGVFDRTAPGGFTVGRADGASDPRLLALAELLEPVGPVVVEADLSGARWSKLAISCAITTLGAIGAERLGVLLRYRWVRRLALEVISEVVAVARCEGVALRKVAGTLDLEWIALTDQERRMRGSSSLVAKHSLLLAVGAKYRRMRSSMLRAMERGRPPAVDFLNGEVVQRAAVHGLRVPVNEAACELVHRIAEGRERPGLDTLRDLARSFGIHTDGGLLPPAPPDLPSPTA